MKDDWKTTLSADGENTSKLTADQHFVSLLTDASIKSEGCIREINKAISLNCPMYAIIKKGTKLTPALKKIDWKIKLYFSDEKDLPKVTRQLREAINK